MRPQTLELAAFGPFKKEQTIDFTYFDQQDLFLVTGQTGSGKTFIFDAIMFALYGDTSGGKRGKDELVSQYVEDGTLSYVTLSFMHQGDLYTVKRLPAQYSLTKTNRVKKNQDSESVEIYKEKTLVSSTLKEANTYIKELIGLDANQFRQIVLLPQGEFRRFLSSSSREKEAIFQNIFHTKDLHALQEKLKEHQKVLKEAYQEIEIGKITAIDSINSDGFDSLQKAINLNDSTEIIDELNKAVLEDGAKINANTELTKDINKSIKWHEQIMEVVKTKLNLDKLEETLKNDEENYKQDKDIIEKHDKAVKLKSLEGDYTQKEARVQKGNQMLRELKNEREILSKKAEVAERAFNESKTDFDKIEGLQVEVNQLNDKLAIFEKLTNYQNDIKDKEEKIKALASTIEENRKNESENKEDIEAINQELSEIDTEESALNDFRQSLRDLENDQDNWQKRDESFKQLDREISLNEKALEEYQAKEAEYKENSERFQMASRHFRMNQAGILAQTLEEGEPCPVCGSIDHPNVATLNEDAISEEALDQLEATTNQSQQKVNTCLIEVTTIKETIKRLSNELDVDEENIAQAKKTHQSKKKELEEKLVEIKETIDTKEKFINTKTDKEKRKQDLLNKQATLSKEISANEALIKEHAATVDQLNKNIKEESKKVNGVDKEAVQKTKETLEANIKSAQSNYSDAKDEWNDLNAKLNTTSATLETEEKNLEERKSEAETASKAFKEALEDSGLDESFADLALSYDSYKDKTQAVKNFERQQALYEDKRKESDKALSEVEEKIEDVTYYSEKITQLNEEKETLQSERDTVNGRLSVNQSSLEKLQNFKAQNAELDESYKIVSKLAEKANGDKTTDYISFERYVLGIYFDEIIQAANLRFSEMSNQQYYLLRSDESKGGGAKGLDLDVMDQYTGKSRSVNTLSGGESFKASLSLAMGISDVVQNVNGGISVETLFIDEGFGTLDPEALDEAIEALIELNTNGRMIGIISHVEDLKERIPAHVEVEKTQEGSLVKTVV